MVVTNTSSADTPDLTNPSVVDSLLGNLLDPANPYLVDSDADGWMSPGEVWTLDSAGWSRPATPTRCPTRSAPSSA